MNLEKIDSFQDDYFFLSNFYPAPVRYDGLLFRNNEAAFQAQKSMNKKDREAFTKMNPSEAKQAGRRVELRKDWEQVKIQIMTDIIKQKFLQNPELAEKLLATGEAYLEEGNTWGDRIWGTVNGQGANRLGIILMETREELSRMKENQK